MIDWTLKYVIGGLALVCLPAIVAGAWILAEHGYRKLRGQRRCPDCDAWHDPRPCAATGADCDCCRAIEGRTDA